MLYYLILLTWLSQSKAATREVAFAQSANNIVVEYPIKEGVNSVCRISISNPSTNTQIFNIEVRAWASGDYSGQAPNPSGWSGTQPSASYLNNVSLVSNGQVSYEFVYPQFSAGATMKTQVLMCAGKITVRDNSDSLPGFIVASGVLTAFTSSGALETTGASVGSVYGGIAVFSQVPITINRGKPF